MTQKKALLPALLVAIVIIGIDQLTKYWVLNYVTDWYVVNNYLSFEVVFNRGVSWGLFHSAYYWPFLLVSMLSGAFIVGMSLFTWWQWRFGYSILAETMVLAGAISNMIDRIIYKGVVDFIALTYNGWSWPVFNIADCCIVLGTFLIFVKLNKQ
ncbi:MAG: signal peptidase II [Candidatus Dependentiae bacterium]